MTSARRGIAVPAAAGERAGGHLIFVDPCTPALVKEAPAGCTDVAKDAAEVDRAAILRRVEAEVADFLRNNL